MSIDSFKGIEPGVLFTTDGSDAWEVKSCSERPTLELVNLKTGETCRGAIGCPNFERFYKVTFVTEPAEDIFKKQVEATEHMKAIAKAGFLKFSILKKLFQGHGKICLPLVAYILDENGHQLSIGIQDIDGMISFLEKENRFERLKAVWKEGTGEEWKE